MHNTPHLMLCWTDSPHTIVNSNVIRIQNHVMFQIKLSGSIIALQDSERSIAQHNL